MRFLVINLFLMLSAIVGSLNSYGQSGSIVSGVVMDDVESLEFASVYIVDSKFLTETDEKGRFRFVNVPQGKHVLRVKMFGYAIYNETINVHAGKPVSLKVKLEQVIESIDPVVVSGTMKEVSKMESPVPVEVYTPKFFKANPTPSIFESMQNVNGVRPQLNCNVCNTGDIHINGLEGPYTMILIDGMPIVSGLSTVYGLTGIPQALIERVEIVKGPASTLYGSEAVGGLVNLITKKPTNAPVLSADVFTTSWGEVNSDLGIKFKVGEKANSLLGVNYFIYKNPIDNNKDGFTDVTLQNRISVFNKVSFQRKDNKLFTLAGRYVYENRWGGDMNWEPQYRGGDQLYAESIYTNRWELFGIYQLPFEENVNFQLSANGHDQNSVYGDMWYLAQQYVGFGQLVWNKEIGVRHDILSGAAFRYTYYDDNTPATAEFDTINTPGNMASITYLPGIFVQDEISLNEHNKLLLGMRYDYNSRHGNILSPRVNYKWSTPNKRNVLRLSAGNGYRVANVFTEDHAALTGAREIVFEGELEPEKSWNANLNFVKKFVTKNNTFIDLDATIFYTYFNNRIIADYDTDPNKIIYGNLNGFAISQGVSLNLDFVFRNGFKARVGCTAQDVYAEETGVKEDQVLTEKYSAVWNAGYTFKKIGLTIDYTGNLYGPMRLPLLSDTDPRLEYSPWWSIQNIQLTKVFKKGWEIYGGVKNLLNYTPPANSIARSFDPFDKDVQFDADGNAIATANNPNALTFDPSYVFAPNQGVRGFFGVRYTIE